MPHTYECEHCFKTFKSKDSRHHHLSRYHGYDPIAYNCEKCPKTFRYKDDLIVHMSDSHQQTNMRYECGQCASSFKYSHHLVQHVRQVHSPHKKVYTCNECGKTFQRRDGFAQHMKCVHAQMCTLYRCELCNRIYRSRAALKIHVNMNHNENFRRSACPYCPSDFKWPHHLKMHLSKVHVELNIPITQKFQTNRCYLCQVQFSEKIDMFIHMRNIHNLDVDIYKCCQCTAVFNLKESLLRHLELHEDSKGAHMCGQCHPVLNPKLYIGNEQLEMNAEEDYGLRVEDEIVDFDVTIMENPELRQMIKYKLRHSKKNKSLFVGHLKQPMESGESDDENLSETEPIVQLIVGESSVEQNGSNIGESEPNYEKDLSDGGESMMEVMVEYSSPTSPVVNENTLLEKTNTVQSDVAIEKSMPVCKYSCHKCNSTFATLKSLDVHYKVSHCHNETDADLLNINCKKLIIKLHRIDDAKTGRDNTVKKVKNVKKKMFKCKQCNMKFSKPLEIARHVRFHHIRAVRTSITENVMQNKNNLRKYKCKKCPMAFTKLQKLALHAKRSHKNIKRNMEIENDSHSQAESNNNAADKTPLDGKQGIENPNNDISNIPSTDVHANNECSQNNQTENVYECGTCALFFKSKLELLRHISSAHMNIKDIKSTKYNKLANDSSCDQTANENLLEIQETEQHSTYKCVACSINFESDSELTQHLKMEHRHKCGICSIAFVHKEKLIHHLKSQHEGRPKEHKCDICNAVFKLAASLAKHIDTKHHDKNTNEPRIVTKDMEKTMHKCDHCSALFPFRESLQRHIQLEHDIGSVHKCGACTAMFNDIEEFKEHLQIEHIM